MDLTLNSLNIALIICVASTLHDACEGYVLMRLPLTTAPPPSGTHNSIFCRNKKKIMSHVYEEATESLRKKSFLLSGCIFLTLPSHTYLHMWVLKIKSVCVITWHFCKKCTPRKGGSRMRTVIVKMDWKQDSGVCYKAIALAVRDSTDVGAAGGALHLSCCSTRAALLREHCCATQWSRNQALIFIVIL